MAKFKIKTNAEILQARLSKKSRQLVSANDKAVLAIALAATTFIKERTLSGKDVRGKEFASYSKATIEHKRKRGGRHFTGNVDLVDKGRMLSSMQARSKSSNTAIIGFTRSAEKDKASRHMNGKGVPKREFFGLSKQDESRFFNMYKKRILKELR